MAGQTVQIAGKGSERTYRRVCAVRVHRCYVCIVDPMSIAAALGLTSCSCERSTVAILVRMHPSVRGQRRVWAMPIRYLTDRDNCRGSVTTVKSASAHVPRFLTGSKSPIS